ncbi:LLM class flavin-dependent oxidoreductase [Rhizobium rhizogenes]|uniref:Monooxygenase protein n=1 Tax=Rhizobium rhizogenes (strain K84 / ATCC BAA-868) TaxID=311403 RepID=B9JPJ0_RHIR8|nr:monooxygenase protein [Rhizobium rhizogenes K84]
MPKKIRLNAFLMNTIGHVAPGLWRHPEDQTRNYRDLEFWTNVAQLSERGLFDSVFIADIAGTYDIYGGNDVAALRYAAQSPINDPVVLVSAMSAVTKHIGFGITVGTSYEHPFLFARRFSTLDHITKGRIAWNIVTGFLPSFEKNQGRVTPTPHDERYDHAEEYMEVAYKLWEGSWEDDAIIENKATGHFTNPKKIHHIGHHGRYYDVPGVHLSEPSPQRTPLLFQAGASPSGVKFAARHAEAIFIDSPTKAVIKRNVDNYRRALLEAGRSPESVVIYAGLGVITAETDEAARAKYEDYLSHASVEGALALLSGWIGVDLSRFGLNDPLGNVEGNAILSLLTALKGENAEGETWRIRDMAKFASIGGVSPLLIGSPRRIVDALEEIAEETGVDGFNLVQIVVPGTLSDVVELIVPELQARDLYPTEYEEGTLRHKFFGQGDRLSSSHRASRYRVGGDLSTIGDAAERLFRTPGDRV